MNEVELKYAKITFSDVEGVQNEIKKYQEMIALLKDNKFPLNTGDRSSSLCQTYNHYNEHGETLKCVGCPIGSPKCGKTPYVEIHKLQVDILQKPELFESLCPKLIEECKHMVIFLEGCLSRLTSQLTSQPK
jgi:hypothetical protein